MYGERNNNKKMYTKKRSAQNMKNIIIYIIMIAVFLHL